MSASMLNDGELDQLATAEVRRVHQHHLDATASGISITAMRLFALTAPPGAFYVQRLLPEGSGDILGTVGFFVDRRTGEVRHISPAEFLDAAGAVATHTGLHCDGEVTPPIIEWLLTHPTDDPVLPSRLSPAPRQRRWWEFWK